MNGLIFPEHKENANLPRLFRVYGENGARCWSKQNVDIPVTMAPKKMHTNYIEKWH